MSFYTRRFQPKSLLWPNMLIAVGLAAILVIVGLATYGSYESAADTALRTLESQGYSNVVVTGTSVFTAPAGYEYSVEFEATGITGRSVTGRVCVSALYGNAVRLD